MILAPEGTSSAKKINILYAENGYGKTTLIRFIYYLLSPEWGKDYKGWICRLPFERAFLSFTDGSSFEVSKAGLIGSYSVTYTSPDGSEYPYNIVANEDGKVQFETEGTQVAALRTLLRNRSFDLFYITDRREYLTTSSISEKFKLSAPRRPRREVYDEVGRVRLVREPDTENINISVPALSGLITDWFQSQIIESGLFAQQNANSIYLDLIKSISSANDKNMLNDREELFREIDNAKLQLKHAEQFGAVPAINLDEYFALVRDAPSHTIPQLSLVISPFLESISLRLNAVKPAVDRIKMFIGEINNFYRDKEFSFNFRTGLSIQSKDTGLPVDLNWLSSGERQLFTILGSVFLTHNSSGIVLLDEPEISLNVLWQREFVGALKRISATSPVQYILASHSLEMLNHPDANVIPLNK